MADTHKVKVLLTAEAGKLRRGLEEASRSTRRLGRAFDGSAGKGDRMADRARAAGKRVEGAQVEARSKVAALLEAFGATGTKAGEMAGKAEAAGERVEGAQTEATAKVATLREGFAATGTKAGEMAGKAEAAGERVEGAQVEARSKVAALLEAFGATGTKAGEMAGKAEAAGERVEGAQTEATAKVATLREGFAATGTKAGEMAGKAEAAGERVEGAQTEATAKVATLREAFGATGTKAGEMAGKAEAAGERVEGAQTEATAKVATLREGFAATGTKAGEMAGKAEAAGERVEGAQVEARSKVATLREAFGATGTKAGEMAGKAEAAGERVEGAQTEATAKVATLREAFGATGTKAGEMAGKAEAAGERVEGAQTEARAKVAALLEAFGATGTKAGEMAGKAEAAGERVEGAQRESVAEVKRLGQAFGAAGKRATKMGQTVATMRQRAFGAVGSLGAAFGLAGGAFAIGATARNLASVETRTERLGVVSQRSTEQMNALRDEIYAVANDPDIRIDPSQLLTGVETIFERTGDLDFARENLLLIAQAIQGSGGTGQAIGGLVSEFKKLNISSREDVEKAFNILFTQGNMGAFTLANMSVEGAKLASGMARLGYTGLRGAIEMGAIAQVAMDVTGNASEATTAVEGLLSTFTDASKLEKIETELGVQVRRGDGSYRDLSAILYDMVAAVDNDIVALSDIFDETGLRVAGGVAGQKGKELYTQSLDVKVTGDEVAGASARIAKTTEAQAQSMRTSIEAKLTEHLTGPLRNTATALAEFQAEILAATGAGFLLAGAFKAVKGGIGLVGAFKARGAGEAAGETLEGAFEAGPDGDPRERGAKREAGKRGRRGGIGDAVLGGAAGAAAAQGAERPTGGARPGGLARSIGAKAFKAVPVLGTALVAAEIAAEVVDAAGFESMGLDADTRRAYQTRRPFAAPAEDAATFPVPDDALPDWRMLPPLEPAPRTVETRGNIRYQSRVIVNVQSDSADPKQVAQEVADEIERRQRDQRLRLDDSVPADGPAEIVF